MKKSENQGDFIFWPETRKKFENRGDLAAMLLSGKNHLFYFCISSINSKHSFLPEADIQNASFCIFTDRRTLFQSFYNRNNKLSRLRTDGLSPELLEPKTLELLYS